jgi:Fungal specific transcription factor domain
MIYSLLIVNRQVSGLSDGISWNIETIQKALGTSPSPIEEHTRSLPGLVKSVWLPVHEEAVLLFENYAKNIDYLQHVISAPSVRVILDQVYTHVIEHQPVESSYVALLLSIFASTAYYWTSRSDCDHLFLTSQDASQASLLWSKATLDVLEHSRRTTSGSIEDIQATIILSFLVFNLEGFSARSQSLMATALVTARNLSLHKLDAQHQERQSSLQDSCIEIEVKRRIWWHIVATDWSVPRFDTQYSFSNLTNA